MPLINQRFNRRNWMIYCWLHEIDDLFINREVRPFESSMILFVGGEEEEEVGVSLSGRLMNLKRPRL